MHALSRLAAAASVLTLALATPALAQTWNETGDAGDVIATAQATLGTGPLTGINAQLANANDADLFCIHLASVPPAGSPLVQLNCIVNGGPHVYLFDANGLGIAVNETCAGGEKTIVAPNVSLPVGDYFVAVAYNGLTPASLGGPIWQTGLPGQRAPDGPGAAQPLIGWAGAGIVQPLSPYHLTLGSMTFCSAAVPTRRQSWGALKAHYR